MNKINILIAGATGYIGISLVKILSKHKYANIKYLCGNNSVGKKLFFYDKSLKKSKLPKIVKFKKEYLKNVDVVFTALPNGDAQKISKKLYNHNKLIDLSGDFRLKNSSDYQKWYKRKHLAKENINQSIYFLPELKKNNIKNFKIISCQGCYPTSILLPLIPLLKKRLIENFNITIDSKSGYSGGGRNIKNKFKNININETITAYGIKNHRHNSEIKQELEYYSSSNKIGFTFTPHLTPMFRGILSNIYIEKKKNTSINKIISCLKNTYKNCKFIKIMKKNKIIGTSNVINTNKCQISVCSSLVSNKIIILSALDNLIKGGAGQAVQNFNILYDFNEHEGLN